MYPIPLIFIGLAKKLAKKPYRLSDQPNTFQILYFYFLKFHLVLFSIFFCFVHFRVLLDSSLSGSLMDNTYLLIAFYLGHITFFLDVPLNIMSTFLEKNVWHCLTVREVVMLSTYYIAITLSIKKPKQKPSILL